MSALEGASKYLNNLLLARGLLPDGKPIDFARSSYQGDIADATMSQVINLIHDLILRRDRGSEQHEAMADSIRSLRSIDTQRTLELQQMQDRNQQLRNDAASAQSQERIATISVKKMEAQIRELKDQNLRMKSMLDQVRARCTSDIKKRDMELEKLKNHLTGLQRGKKEVGGMKINAFNHNNINAGKSRSGVNVNSIDWSLENETNDFLAALVNETSAENVSLRQLVSGSLDVLKDMTGYSEQSIGSEDDGIGIPGQYRSSRRAKAESIVPIESLTTQMDEVLQHCRTILKDPSFVPIEEVQIREEEIVKLRAGWERMADRWKEAIVMMEQWKQRMMLEGKEAYIGGFSDLSFGHSIAVRPDGQPILELDTELSVITDDRSKIASVETTVREVDALDDVESELELLPEPAIKRLASSPARRGVRIPRQLQALGEAHGNSGNRLHKVPRAQKPSENSETENQFVDSNDESESNKLTIPQKLAAIEAEAAKAEKQRLRDSTKKRKPAPSKERSLKSGRRRSTLDPAELAKLLRGG